MTDKQDNFNRDMAVRSTAINMAIAAQCGLCHGPEGRVVYDPEEIVKAAKAFENYIKGNKPDTKEAW